MSELIYLKDLWSESDAAALAADPVELLRYRSNLLGADLRITNFGGGNTSSKVDLPDPFTGKPTRVLGVKGSGGDLGSIKKTGFALLYMEKLNNLRAIYKGEAHEDEMVAYYPLSAFGDNRVAASIDTPLHAFLPFPHVDHLHPDWAIALAASANGREKLDEFNTRFGKRIVWLPWQRPGFELALMLARAVEANPGCDGILLASHGLFTWGSTQRECYVNSVRTIDQMGQFVLGYQNKAKVFGGMKVEAATARQELAAKILPAMRGHFGRNRRAIGHFTDCDDALLFANSARGRELAKLGTSCPDHFLRTRVFPLFVDWDPATGGGIDGLKKKLGEATAEYRESYRRYYEAHKEKDSPAMRDSNPTVAIVPGVGLFSFGKNKTEARITGEFFLNAIRVMAGATAMASGKPPAVLPHAKHAEDSASFTSFDNYVALPPREAYRVEYWQLEEAKLKRMPPEAEFSRKIFLVVGGGSGIGRSTALDLVRRGAHVVVADINAAAAESVAREAATLGSKEGVASCVVDLASRESIARAIEETVLRFGGLDGVINTGAIFPVSGQATVEELWRRTMEINVTGNWLLAQEARRVFTEQGLTGVIILTSSANAVVPKHGSEAYDTSKSAVNTLVRELAISMAPAVRVNGIAPATVVEGSTMFGRARVMESLTKYKIEFSESESDESLRDKLAGFYAQRTLTRRPITPRDCANAILWLAGDGCPATTGHVFPVDGGLPEAFLR